MIACAFRDYQLSAVALRAPVSARNGSFADAREIHVARRK
jgi:hypothetical protein